MRATTEERTWWARPGLEARDGRLTIAGRDAETLAREHGTPVFVYELERAVGRAEELRDAFADADVRGIVRYALKAQREPRFLRYLREYISSHSEPMPPPIAPEPDQEQDPHAG